MLFRVRNGAQQQLKRRIGSPSQKSISLSPALVLIGGVILALMMSSSLFFISMSSHPRDDKHHHLLESKTKKPVSPKIRHHSTAAKPQKQDEGKSKVKPSHATPNSLLPAKHPIKHHESPKHHQHHEDNHEVKRQPVHVLDGSAEGKHNTIQQTQQSQVLKAFLEPIDMSSWEIKPLPVRVTATADQLTEVKYPKLNSCSKLPEQWPTDEYPNADPFLPWIHDVFPTHDGKFIQFVAQNKRRCRTHFSDPSESRIVKAMQPQVAIFQHVAVKRINVGNNETENRYRLASHEEADPDGHGTRFICRFKPSMKETLSVFNFDYDLAAHRKGLLRTFSEAGMDNKNFVTSQLIFQCPVPEELVETVRTGSSVQDDWASLFLDLVPIRTPPRYGAPNAILPPWYKHMETKNTTLMFDPVVEWGDQHILPKIKDAGRWENIPICKPSMLTYEPERAKELAIVEKKDNTEKAHKLVICVWASASFATRGDRYTVNDGQRRLNEWLHFNFLVGFDHIYIYDNSGAFSSDVTLQPITDKFQDKVTRVVWPAKVCNNRHNTEGERSSQYAAESSCRLRFGPHVEWIGSFDVDEYIVPVGQYNSLLPLLDKLDEEGKKIISFPSFRSWARKEHIE